MTASIGQIVLVHLDKDVPAIVTAVAKNGTVDVFVFAPAGGRPMAGLSFYASRTAFETAFTDEEDQALQDTCPAHPVYPAVPAASSPAPVVDPVYPAVPAASSPAPVVEPTV